MDLAILRVLQRDNKTPHRVIGEEVNLSAPAVQRRVARLEKAGVIRRQQAVIEPAALGVGLTVVVEVHLRADRTAVVEPAKARFRAAPEIQQCYYVAGNGGFIIIMLVPDMAAYEDAATRLFAEYDDVTTFRTLVVRDAVKVGLDVAF